MRLVSRSLTMTRLLSAFLLFLFPVIGFSGTNKIQDWWKLNKRQILQKVKGINGTDVDDPFYALFQWAQDIDETYPGTGIYYVSNFSSIQAAIDSAHAHGGGKVILECDTVTVTSSIVLYSNIWLSGLGPCSVIRSSKSSTASLPVIILESSRSDSDVVISDLKIEPDTTAAYAVEYDHGIDIRDAKRVLVRNITMPQCVGDGVYISSASYILIENCYFSGVQIASAYNPPCPRNAVAVVDGSDIWIQNNSIVGDFQPAAVDIEPNAGGVVNRVFVTKNRCKNTGGAAVGSYGISIVGSADSATVLIERVNVSNNFVSGYYRHGIGVWSQYGNVADVNIADNVIDSCGFGDTRLAGIWILQGGRGYSVTNNRITNTVSGTGILYEATSKWVRGRDIVIANNTVRRAGSNGIYVYSDTSATAAELPPLSLVVSGNVVDSVSVDGIYARDLIRGLVISSNFVIDAGRYGFDLADCDSFVFVGNASFNAATEDIRLAGIPTYVLVGGNLSSDATRKYAQSNMRAIADSLAIYLTGSGDTRSFQVRNGSDSLIFRVLGHGRFESYIRSSSTTEFGAQVAKLYAGYNVGYVSIRTNKDTIKVYNEGGSSWPYLFAGGYVLRPGSYVLLDGEGGNSYIWYNTSTNQVEIYDDGTKVFPVSGSVSGTALNQTFSLGAFTPYQGTNNGVYVTIGSGGYADVRLPGIHKVHDAVVKLDSVFIRTTYVGIASGSIDSINVWSVSPTGSATWLGHALDVGETLIGIDTGDTQFADNYNVIIRAYDSDTNWAIRTARLKWIW